MMTGPTKRPSRPNTCNPPKIPTKANRNGSWAVPLTRAGQIRLSPTSIIMAPTPNTNAAFQMLPPLRSSTRAAVVNATQAPNGSMANAMVSKVKSNACGTPASAYQGTFDDGDENGTVHCIANCDDQFAR